MRHRWMKGILRNGYFFDVARFSYCLILSSAFVLVGVCCVARPHKLIRNTECQLDGSIDTDAVRKTVILFSLLLN